VASDSTAQDARGWVIAGCAIYLAFFVYGSLVPLHWTPQPVAAAWQAFTALPGPQWRGEERVDVAVNFLLTFPLAFGWAHLASAGRMGLARLLSGMAVWPGLALLSLLVEFAQVFFPPRDPSWTDVAAQWAGALAGVAAYAAAGGRFRSLLRGLAPHQAARARSQRWLAVYLGLLLAFSVMPLDLTISPIELYRKWRDGGVILVPFGAPWQGAWQFAYDFASDVGLWVPVGMLWRLDGRSRRFRAVVLRGLLAAAAVECAQLLVLSRLSDVTDVLLAGVGVALGAALPSWLRGWSGWAPARQARWLAVGVCLWLVAAVVVLWSPFDFTMAQFSTGRAIEAFTRLPFQTYFFRGEFGALNEIVRKLLVFLPGGLLLGAWAARRPDLAVASLGLVALCLTALVFEIGQLFVPSKVADTTDAVLGCLGAWTGWRIARSLTSVALTGVDEVQLQPAQPRPSSAGAYGATAPAAPVRGHWAWLLICLFLLFWLAGRLPGLPYNMAKLMPAGFGGALAAAGLALVLWWMLAAPLWVLRADRRAWRLALPAVLGVHALVAFVVLYLAVPLEMIHKIVGTPVLGLGGPWETLGRYTALHMSLMLPLVGAVLLVQTILRPAAIVDLIYWVLVVLLLFWPLHWVVVEQAATDNLVELMRGGGGLAASACLALGWGLLALAGSALGAAAASRQRLLLLSLGVAAVCVAPLLLTAGLEPLLVKYGKAFSAAQFIVSAGRDRYATGVELSLRVGLALTVMVLAIAALQALAWRASAAADRPASPREPGESGGLGPA
jgi:glycopeptide antibiotics resistance protein